MQVPLLQISDLSVRYQTNGSLGREALRRVSFSMDPGDTLVILGPNGSGKSTLLHAIAGNLDAQFSGHIEMSGVNVAKTPNYRRSHQMAIVHQDPARGTAAHLTLRE